MGDYSTLDMLNMAFGKSSSSEWLTAHLAELNTFSGSKNMDNDQTKSLSKILAQEYKEVKFSVLMLFFYKFKCGYFGKFYGKVDPMVITCALKDFMHECEMKRQKFLHEEYEERRAEEERIIKAIQDRWANCQNELCSSCSDVEGKKVFGDLELYSFSESDHLLTLLTAREDYELIEGKYIQLFSFVIRRHYPNVRIQYRLRPTPIQQSDESNEHKVSLRKKSDNVQSSVESAKRIISNMLGFDKDTLENMRYSFKLRYKCWPEEYVARYEKKNEVSDNQNIENQK